MTAYSREILWKLFYSNLKVTLRGFVILVPCIRVSVSRTLYYSIYSSQVFIRQIHQFFSFLSNVWGSQQHCWIPYQHSSSTFTIPVTADGTITEISTWRTFPCGIHQSLFWLTLILCSFCTESLKLLVSDIKSTMGIKFIMIQNRAGKTRLAKW